jgi:L-threonylcarbamoyladenylate synthase
VETDLASALAHLRQGLPVAIPTETVYGLAADATNPDAVARVFATKGRPADHPLIMHLGDAGWAEEWAQLPVHFRRLAAKFWPGPLTLVVPRKPAVHPSITGGQDTVALRVPAHPLTLELLRQFGRPLVAPSANRFGHTSPTTAAHVRAEFPHIPVLDGGACRVGVESTIVDLSSGAPRVLRPGQLGREELEDFLGVSLGQASVDAPRVPGALDRHYAPTTPTRFADAEPAPGRWGWLGFAEQGAAAAQVVMPADPEDYARRLYAALRELDEEELDVILVEHPPTGPRWEAVWDRLRRAAHS